MKKKLSKQEASRREFVKKAAYVAPVILTLQAAPSFAKSASGPTTTKAGDEGRMGRGHN